MTEFIDLEAELEKTVSPPAPLALAEDRVKFLVTRFRGVYASISNTELRGIQRVHVEDFYRFREEGAEESARSALYNATALGYLLEERGA